MKKMKKNLKFTKMNIKKIMQMKMKIKQKTLMKKKKRKKGKKMDV